MVNFKKILILVIVILTFGIAWKYFKKIAGARKLSIGEIILNPEKKISTFSDLVDVFKNGLKLKGYVAIRNFSQNDYTLNQINVDCFTPKTNSLLAEQTNINPNEILLRANQITNIPFEFKVDIINSLLLFKECEVIPQEWTIWKIIQYPVEAYKVIELKKLRMKLKGFVQAEGITLPIDQDYYLYE
ncbi:MAG: hypothetical protein C0596_19080 [Marinilabiliales bacterium]|nr:MAG: hypothetical protein C0596_19080 [Marinilabiliales bacterium]